MGAWTGALLSALSAAGGAFGGSKQTQTTTPLYDPTVTPFRNKLLNLWNSYVSGTPAFDAAYRRAGENSIVSNANNVSNSISDLLTSRGLGRTSAGVGTLRDTLYNMGSDLANFRNKATLDLDTRKQQLLSGAGGFVSSIPLGSETTSEGGPVSPLYGAISGGAQGIATWLGQKSANDNFMKTLKAMGKG